MSRNDVTLLAGARRTFSARRHRLRFRLRGGYDYARDFGGIRYVFCRGLDVGRTDSPGIHAQRFTPELVDALDALFGFDSLPLPLAGEGRGQGAVAHTEMRT